MPHTTQKYTLKNSKPSTIQVIADDRESKSGTFEALKAFDGVALTIKRLGVGDYEIDGKLLLERKTLLDLAASIKDGRLFRQACRLASSPVRSAIILEGTTKDLVSSGMRREAIQGALISLTILFDIPILRSMNPEESAKLMIYAARQVNAIAKGALPRQGFRPKGKRKRQLYILQGLPGVGPERAQRLLDTFGSVEAVFTAKADELQAVSGIGSGTAGSIRWLVKENTPCYFSLSADPIL